MTAIAQKIERDIRQLSLEDMLALHETILASIGEKEREQHLAPSYIDDIQRRIREIDSENVTGLDALQTLEEL